MIGCLPTHVRKQPIIALYFESDIELEFYSLEARFNNGIVQLVTHEGVKCLHWVSSRWVIVEEILLHVQFIFSPKKQLHNVIVFLLGCNVYWGLVILLCRKYEQCQGTKIFQYCTCPAGRVTYNFHSSCKHMHLSFKKCTR